jgi:hypothetical protein
MVINTGIIKNLPKEISGFLIRDDSKTVYKGNPASKIPDMTIYSKSGKLPGSLVDEMIKWIQKNDAKKESRPDWGLFIATMKAQNEVMTISLTIDTTVKGGSWSIELRVEIITENN